MTIHDSRFTRAASFKSAIALLAALSCAAAGAQEDDSITPPRAETRNPPAFIHPAREGAVHLRFTVTAEGATEDIEVIGGFTTDEFNQAALSTVSEWTYEPATVGGNPIAYHNRQYVLSFPRSEQPGISETVRTAYQEIGGLIEGGEHEDAVTRIREMLETGAVTLLDFALLSDLLATAYLEQERYHEALAAARQATITTGAVDAEAGQEDYLLPEGFLEAALRKRFALSVSLSHNRDAEQTYQRLTSFFNLPDDDPLHEQMQAVRGKLDSPQPMGQIGRITEDTWSYTPMRPTFTVTDVQGELESIDVYCERRNTQLEFQEGVEWTLPAVFGECELGFNGEEGTTFTFYEFDPAQLEG